MSERHSDAPEPQNAASVPRFQRFQWGSLALAAVGAGLCWLGFETAPGQFFRSYLLAWLFWVGLSLGCLSLIMLHHLTGGAWGALLLRLLEAGARLLPCLALAGLPLLWNLEALYSWARPASVAADPLLQHKALYLNETFFTQRAAGYFLVWSVLALLLPYWARRLDRHTDPTVTRVLRRRLQLWSAGGLVLHALAVTFAAIDWLMSLEPVWYSTIYGVLWLTGHLVQTMAGAIIMATLLATVEPFARFARPQIAHDLGNLLLAFVMLWTYISFAQFLIIWSANLPEEIPWYLARTQGGWEWLAIALVLFHFLVPFLVLLSRQAKRRLPTLALVAGMLLVMQALHLCWLVIPAFHPGALTLHWLDPLSLLSLGALWYTLYLLQVRHRPLVPANDLRLQKVALHE
ncbi:MAG: hypothetical protein AB7N91_27770 [Candidatus Tectimicrobiota bacterium]